MELHAVYVAESCATKVIKEERHDYKQAIRGKLTSGIHSRYEARDEVIPRLPMIPLTERKYLIKLSHDVLAGVMRLLVFLYFVIRYSEFQLIFTLWLSHPSYT